MVSFAGKLVGYKIIYMLLFLLCLCLYQVCRRHQSRGLHSEVLLNYDPHHQLLVISILQYYFIGPTATSYVCFLLLLSTLHTQTNMRVTQGQLQCSTQQRNIVVVVVHPHRDCNCYLYRQVYYSLWRRLLKVFWWLVVAYTMLVLITIYTFQFEDFPAYWKNFTGFTEEQYVSPTSLCGQD